VEGVEGFGNEFRSQPPGELLLVFRKTWSSQDAAEARHFVGLRYAQAFSCLASAAVFLQESPFELPPVSFCSHPDTFFWMSATPILLSSLFSVARE